MQHKCSTTKSFPSFGMKYFNPALFSLSPVQSKVQHKAESNLAPHRKTLLPTPCHLSAFHSHQDHPHLQDATGFGKTTPAVYTAWNSPCWCTRLVISLIKTGATRFERSFLCTHRKLISTIFFVLKKREKNITLLYTYHYMCRLVTLCVFPFHVCVQLYFVYSCILCAYVSVSSGVYDSICSLQVYLKWNPNTLGYVDVLEHKFYCEPI